MVLDAGGVFIARLLLGQTTAVKLARRGIDPDEVAQLPANGAIVERNPRPRVDGSRMLIGPTDGGRLLTVIIEPDHLDDALWHVRTAWESSAREKTIYHRRRRL